MTRVTWVVRCPASVEDLTTAELLEMLERADLRRLGEEIELRGMTSAAAKQLRFTEPRREAGSASAELHYWPPGVERVWKDPGPLCIRWSGDTVSLEMHESEVDGVGGILAGVLRDGLLQRSR